jgi:hypothetical protein
VEHSLELGKHASFYIIRDRSVMKERLDQMGLIISFKDAQDALLCDEPGQAGGFIDDTSLIFGIRFLGKAMR